MVQNPPLLGFQFKIAWDRNQPNLTSMKGWQSYPILTMSDTNRDAFHAFIERTFIAKFASKLCLSVSCEGKHLRNSWANNKRVCVTVWMTEERMRQSATIAHTTSFCCHNFCSPPNTRSKLLERHFSFSLGKNWKVNDLLCYASDFIVCCSIHVLGSLPEMMRSSGYFQYAFREISSKRYCQHCS